MLCGQGSIFDGRYTLQWGLSRHVTLSSVLVLSLGHDNLAMKCMGIKWIETKNLNSNRGNSINFDKTTEEGGGGGRELLLE